jgi:hypothetical protein
LSWTSSWGYVHVVLTRYDEELFRARGRDSVPN